jgi:hypothetical protein
MWAAAPVRPWCQRTNAVSALCCVRWRDHRRLQKIAADHLLRFQQRRAVEDDVEGRRCSGALWTRYFFVYAVARALRRRGHSRRSHIRRASHYRELGRRSPLSRALPRRIGTAMITVGVIRNGATYLSRHLRQNDYWAEGEKQVCGECAAAFNNDGATSSSSPSLRRGQDPGSRDRPLQARG